MGHRGKRTRLATGIYADRYGITVRVAGRDIGRWPLGTPLEELRNAQRDWKRDREVAPVTRHGSLGEWFDAYLATFPNGPHRRDESALLEHWRAAGFADRPPGALTAIDVRQQLARFAAETKIVDELRVRRFAPRTINHMRRVLGAVYTAKNGRSGFNPVRDVPKVTVRDEEARAIPYELVEFIFTQMPDRGRPTKGSTRPTISKAKIRLRVMAYTGRPPAEIKRIQPRDLFLEDRAMLARPRRKGAGAHGKRLPLTDQAVAALRDFVQHQCFGAFSTRSAGKTWRLAVDKARAQWHEAQRDTVQPLPWPLPDDVRAYDLRHSFASTILRAGGSRDDVATMLLHTNLEMSRRYTLAVVDEQAVAAVAKLTAFLRAGATRVPHAALSGAKNGPKRESRPTVRRGRGSRRKTSISRVSSRK